MTHVLSMDDSEKKWSCIYRTRKVDVAGSLGEDNKLISRHVELQVRNQVATESLDWNSKVRSQLKRNI